jgi:tRNA(Ile)-lysidine synthase
MLNKLHRFISQNEMIQTGDLVICAISGGADSVALLFAMYLLREKLRIALEAAHFNHNLRGDESQRDEEFVRQLCDRLDIPLHVGTGCIEAGKKGLEAAARDARYAYLLSLGGKIATAHTANDNAETVLMHLVRGTGLKGLGGIVPMNGRLIRPMLNVTRQEVLAFLEEYNLSFVEDSSNNSDRFLRNRLRHNVMPLLEEENPSLVENLSAMALRLRKDEQLLDTLAQDSATVNVPQLRAMPESLRSRVIVNFLKTGGVPEPESEHIDAICRLINSDKPSAKIILRNGVTVARNYDVIEFLEYAEPLEEIKLTCPGTIDLENIGVRICCEPATMLIDAVDAFTIIPCGTVLVRCRRAGDKIRLHGGSKELKKLFIDRKIPASHRVKIPVLSDDKVVLGVYGFGANRDRLAFDDDAILVRFETI